MWSIQLLLRFTQKYLSARAKETELAVKNSKLRDKKYFLCEYLFDEQTVLKKKISIGKVENINRFSIYFEEIFKNKNKSSPQNRKEARKENNFHKLSKLISNKFVRRWDDVCETKRKEEQLKEHKRFSSVVCGLPTNVILLPVCWSNNWFLNADLTEK